MSEPDDDFDLQAGGPGMPIEEVERMYREDLKPGQLDLSSLRGRPAVEIARAIVDHLDKGNGPDDRQVLITAAYALMHSTLPDAEHVAWLRKSNAMVRFQSNGTVSVKVNFTTRRRKTLAEAIAAVKAAESE